MNILFASHNSHKINEIKEIVPPQVEIISLTDAGIHEEIPETGATLEENAILKAATASRLSGLTSFADDTGLEVEALDGAPGVQSARFAGEEKDMNRNIEKLLALLSGKSSRKARFRTVIALTDGQNTHLFEGVIEGTLTEEKRGSGGFGYDPIFIPDGESRTFAQMSQHEKNSISHRAEAVKKLANHLAEKVASVQ